MKVGIDMMDYGQNLPEVPDAPHPTGLPDADFPDAPPSRRRRLAGSILSGLVSMVIHAMLVVGLGLWTIPPQPQSEMIPLVASSVDRSEELLTEQLDDVRKLPDIISAKLVRL